MTLLILIYLCATRFDIQKLYILLAKYIFVFSIQLVSKVRISVVLPSTPLICLNVSQRENFILYFAALIDLFLWWRLNVYSMVRNESSYRWSSLPDTATKPRVSTELLETCSLFWTCSGCLNLKPLTTQNTLKSHCDFKAGPIREGHGFEKGELARIFLLSASFRQCSILIFWLHICSHRTNG